MKVLMIGNVGVGGHARYCTTLAHELSALGCDVLLHGTPLFPTPWYCSYRALRSADRLVRTVAFSATTLNAIRAFRPQVIHYQLVSPLVDFTWIPLVARRIPSVMTVHNVEPHEGGIVNHPACVRAVLGSMDTLVLHSPANAQRLLQIHPSVTGRTACVPHGVWTPPQRVDRATARSRLGLPSERPVLLFFGGIRRNKGLELLIRSLGVLRDMSRGGNFPAQQLPLLLIAGGTSGGHTFAPYQGLIDTLELAEHVRTRIEFIPDEDAVNYFCASDIVALPYAPEFQAQSGVLFESYGYGVPVVATNVGALGDTIREDGTGIVVQERTTEAFAAALSDLLQNETRRHSMSQRMRELMEERYSWRHVAKQTLAVYAEVSARSKRNAQ